MSSWQKCYKEKEIAYRLINKWTEAQHNMSVFLFFKRDIQLNLCERPWIKQSFRVLILIFLPLQQQQQLCTLPHWGTAWLFHLPQGETCTPQTVCPTSSHTVPSPQTSQTNSQPVTTNQDYYYHYTLQTVCPTSSQTILSWQTGHKIIKRISGSTQLSMKFFLLINVKMPTTVGILTFMSRKNSILGLPEPKKCWISWCFYTYKH